MTIQKKLAAGTGGSVVVEQCQVCDSPDLESIFFAGYLPPVNGMPSVGARPREEPAYPAEMLRCKRCTLAQLGLVVDPAILFPPTYPYTSGTTRILRENFAELYREVTSIVKLGPGDLAVDIGSNDGTLLKNFKSAGHRVHGIEPTNSAKIAWDSGIETLVSFFNHSAVAEVTRRSGRAKILTATNVFAHIEDVHEVMRGVLELLDDGGIFITESHYLASLLETVQYDTVYHEHLRYYSLGSLKYLLEMHALQVFHARKIPTHGGSMRVYAARKGTFQERPSVAEMLAEEKRSLSPQAFDTFRKAVVTSKLELYSLLKEIKRAGRRIYGVGAPSRATTLINYVGLTEGIIDCVLEIKGSYKIGKYVPGTLIPVVDEARLNDAPADQLLLFSWHIAEELIPKLTGAGHAGDFIVPLPRPHVVTS